MPEIPPGTVFAVAGGGIGAKLIAVGAALLGRPDMQQHVAVMHHYADGVPWGLEGRPSSVGWVDMRKYLVGKKHPYSLSNIDQPLTADQRALVTSNMQKMLGTKYDWTGIAADAMQALRIRGLFATEWKDGTVPGQVVCSSFAAYLYGAAKAPHPKEGHERFCTPGDWSDFITRKAWA
jgi:hypothetical protein